jgi:hypothetical protein
MRNEGFLSAVFNLIAHANTTQNKERRDIKESKKLTGGRAFALCCHPRGAGHDMTALAMTAFVPARNCRCFRQTLATEIFRFLAHLSMRNGEWRLQIILSIAFNRTQLVFCFLQ